MKMKLAVAGAALASVSLMGSVAQANVVDLVQMTFESGATFVGDVTFANNYSYVTAVTGTLTGYQYGHNGYVGTGSDSINWVWANGTNYSTGAGNYSDFLMDGPGSGYTQLGSYYNWILFAYNYSDAPVLTFTSGASYAAQDNYVDYVDPMVHGSISSISATPLPSTWTMLIAGFVGLGFFAYRGTKNNAAAIAAA